MASSVPIQIAETIQTAHIKRDPSPHHDVSPSTAASTKEPVRISSPRSTRSNLGDDAEATTAAVVPDAGEEEDRDDDDEDDDDEIPLSVLRPHRRRTDFPPMPDLRFEQSYLHSIEAAEGWATVAWITVRDQVVMPFAQGIVYNLAICGWQYWNRTAQYSGSSAGARIRRWWYGVNHWPLPSKSKKA